MGRLGLLLMGMVLVGACASPRASHRDEVREASQERAKPSKVTLPEYVGTVALGAGSVAFHFVPQPLHWKGLNPIDEGVRGLLRAPVSARARASTWSDGLQIGLVLYPLLVDSLGVAWLGQGDPERAWQMAAMDAESFALTMFLNQGTKWTGRERPCGRDSGSACGGRDEFQSFMSGHAAAAFTGAGLICAHHGALRLYGEPGDTIVCGGALIAASATGVLRIVADKHYATDVLAGTAVGLVSGYLLPSVLHYGFGGERWVVLPQVSAEGMGIGAAWVF